MPGIRGLRICKACLAQGKNEEQAHVKGSRRKHYKESHNGQDIGVGNRENFFVKATPKPKPAAPAGASAGSAPKVSKKA